MQGTKALLGLVVIMGVLILAGTAGLIGVVVHRLTQPHVTAAPPATSGSSLAAAAHEPAGTRIVAIARQSDTLLSIALTGGGPDRVLVWDVPAQRPVSEISLTP